mgnify:FL=1
MKKRKNRLKLCLTLLTFLMLVNTVLPVFASDDVIDVEEPTQETTSEVSSEDSIQPEEQESESIIQVEESSESDVPETETSTISEAPISQSDLCYIKAFEISELQDGTAPFDDNNDPGNDSAIDNGVVRSFDNVFYTLKYTTAIKNNDGTNISEANVHVKFELPLPYTKAQFDNDSLKWCLDKNISYEYSDGTISSEIIKNKVMVKQTLTGYRHLVNTDAGNLIPGTGTLVVNIKTKSMQNGEIIKPTFTIWIEGSDEQEYQTIESNPITISAGEKLNIAVSQDTGLNTLAYYKNDTGEMSYEKKDGFLKGRLNRYNLVFQANNDTPTKGLKGLTFPEDDITFDLKLTGDLNGVSIDNNDKYNINLWDYDENNNNSRGKLGKTVTAGVNSTYGYYIPYNRLSYGNRQTSCFNGGDWLIEQDENDKTIFHVKISNYDIDYDKLIFPIRYVWSNEGTVNYTPNVNCISSAKFIVLTDFPEDINTTQNLYTDITLNNLKVGNKEVTETNTSDNRTRYLIYLTGKGSLGKYQRFYDGEGRYNLASIYYAADGMAQLGSDIVIDNFIHGSGYEYSLKDFNHLQKFDDKAFEVRDGTFTYSFNRSLVNTDTVKLKVLFAAKPDKTGWKDDKEMETFKEENLIFFENINDLLDAGYTCVAYLYEIRDANTGYTSNGGSTFFDGFMKMKIRNDVSLIGNVYQTVSDVRTWQKDEGGLNFSWTDKVYDENIKAYGLGRSEINNNLFYENYKKPNQASYSTNYQKTYYIDGAAHGHSGGYWNGNSLLIVGNTVGLSQKNNDLKNGLEKTIYDVDAGERTVNLTITPNISVKSGNNTSLMPDIVDDIKLTTTLPKYIHYSKSSIEPKTISTDGNGVTTITWEFLNQSIKDPLPVVKLQVTIGEAGTKNDVNNNESFIITSKITSKNDIRANIVANGNIASTQFSVVKLAASAVTAKTLTEFIDINSNAEFMFRYSNISNVDALGARIYNILPNNNDNRGTVINGSLEIKSVVFDFSHALRSFKDCKNTLKLFASESNEASAKGVADLYLANPAGLDFKEIQGRTVDEGNYKIKYENLSLENIKAIYSYIGRVYGNEYVDIHITLNSCNSNNKEQLTGDIYANNFVQYSDNQASTVISNVVKSSIVKRSVSGYIWIDSNLDGIKQNDEKVLSSVPIKVYRNIKDKNDTSDEEIAINGITYYPAYDAYGIKLNDKSITSGTNGKWEVNNLKEGDYIVVSEVEKKYYATNYHAGEDQKTNSDAQEDNNLIFVADINIPNPNNMTEQDFINEYNNIGLVIKTSLEINKISSLDGKALEGATLSIYNAADYLPNGTIKEDAVPVIEWVSSSKVKVLENLLVAGKGYVLIEKDAPIYHKKAKPITFTVKDDGNIQTIIMQDEYIKPCSLTITKYDGDSNKTLEGVTFNLKFIKADYPESTSKPNYDRTLKVDETKEYVTDKNGKIIITNLEQGTYELTETKTVGGRTLLVDTIEIKLPLEKEVDGVEFLDVAVNIKNSYTIDIAQAGGVNTKTIIPCIIGLTSMGLGILFLLKKREAK